MKRLRKQLPAAAAALLSLVACAAQAAGSDRLDTLTVVVTPDEDGNRLPLAVSTVDADELTMPDEQSLHDFLAPVPGLFALNQDNAAQGLRVSIRGFGARSAFGVRGIRVFADGVPLTLPDGQTELDALDLGLLETVEVIRGPSATLFGNAAGGAIMLTMREAADTTGARFDIQGASSGNRRARLEGSTNFGNSALLGAVADADNDGFRDHAATDTTLANARLDQPLGAGKLGIFASLLDITAQDPGGLTAEQVRDNRRAAAPNNETFNAGEHIEQERLAATWSGPMGDWSLQTTGFAGQRDFANRLPFTDGGQVSFDRKFGGGGITLSRRMQGAWFTHRVSTGLDVQVQQDERQRFDNNNGMRGERTLAQDEEAFSAGLFLRDSFALSRAWEASFGVRYDNLRLEVDDRFLSDGDDSGKRDINDYSADASLSRWFGQGMVYARLATSFETPTINELANPDGGGFNPDLESTDAFNREIGAKGAWKNMDYTLALYRIDVDDELLPFELEGQSGRRFFRNAGKTRREGVELTLATDIASHWSLDGAYSYNSSRFVNGEQDGNRIPGMPRQQARLSLNYRANRFKAALIGSHVGELFADDANSEKVSDYSLLDLRAGLQGTAAGILPAWGVEAAIENLLDRDYNDNIRINAFGGRFFEPAAGRTYRVKLKLLI